MNVMIGVDPHKASHTAVAIDGDEDQLSSVKVRATHRQVDQLMYWAQPFEKRTWAIESVGGLGYLLAQQLVARGEAVLDVPATLASRIRVLATDRSNKNDPNDAHSIAIAALRAPRLRSVEVPITSRCCASWLNATWILGTSAKGSSVVSTRSLPSSHQGELPRNSTFLMRIPSWQR
jgi:transposase